MSWLEEDYRSFEFILIKLFWSALEEPYFLLFYFRLLSLGDLDLEDLRLPSLLIVFNDEFLRLLLFGSF